MAKVKKEKVNLESMSQAHGALPPAQTLQEIMGYTTGYAEASVEEYRTNLDKLTDYDLGAHAIEKDIVPGPIRSLIIDSLERKFLMAQSRFLHKPLSSKMSKENEETLKKILRAGV